MQLFIQELNTRKRKQEHSVAEIPPKLLKPATLEDQQLAFVRNFQKLCR